jgi:hypothetical protein
MTTHTIQVTYELEIEIDSRIPDGDIEGWIEDNVWQAADIGLSTKADIVELVIE